MVLNKACFVHGCNLQELFPVDVPIISVSKGLEVGSGKMMSEVIPSALGRKQPAAFLSGPSFAKEIMDLRPTGIVAASKVRRQNMCGCRDIIQLHTLLICILTITVNGGMTDIAYRAGRWLSIVLRPCGQDAKLAREMQALFASPYLRVNTTTDVTGVEICGALKNVLALAAGIVEGLDLGNNAMAALVAQGCSEIRWLAEKMGAKPATISGLSGLGDIMLTCYGSLSRNRRAPQAQLWQPSSGMLVKLQASLPLMEKRGFHGCQQVCGRAPGEGGGIVRHLGQQQSGCGGRGNSWCGRGPGANIPCVATSAHGCGAGRGRWGGWHATARRLGKTLLMGWLLLWVQVLDGALSPAQAVYEIMNLPQIDES